MAYSVIVSPRAQKEIEDAIDYYSLNSIDAPVNFINALNNAYDAIALNPFFRIRYNNIRAYKIGKFPYVLYFTVNKAYKIVRIVACFHTKRNPDKRP